MPDYDPKSIPILDDIIEDDIVEEDNNEPELAAPELDDFQYRDSDDSSIDSLDLFTANTLDAAEDTAQPELGTLEQLTDSAEDEQAEDNTDTIESALIDYHADQDETALGHHSESQAINESFDVGDKLHEITVAEKALDPVQPATLSSLVDGVVQQLMPDLEQQLRVLVQQALEEKLPEEIVEQLSNKKID